MSVSKEHAERIAQLARLHFDGEELARITTDLNHILAHVEVLRSLATDGNAAQWEGVTPVSPESTTRGEGAERPDALRRPLDAVAPDMRHGFFVVPPLPGTRHDGEGA